MSLIVQCPHCQGKAKIKDEMQNRSVRCPRCGEVFQAVEASLPEHPKASFVARPVVAKESNVPLEEDQAVVSKNDRIIADLQRRISRAKKWNLFFLLLMPLGLIIPGAIGWAIASMEKPQRTDEFTVSQAFGIAAVALPIIAFAGWFLMGSDRAEYRNSLAVAKQADAMGFVFSEKPDKKIMALLDSCRMFADADQSGGKNCCIGEHSGKRVALLDYGTVYKTGLTPTAFKRNRQTVVVVFDLDEDLPEFRVGPTTWLTKISKFLGAQTIELPDYPQFNKSFTLCGDEAEEIIACFSSQVAELILETEATVEVFQGALIYYRHNKVAEQNKFPGMIQRAGQVAQALQG